MLGKKLSLFEDKNIKSLGYSHPELEIPFFPKNGNKSEKG